MVRAGRGEMRGEYVFGNHHPKQNVNVNPI